MGSYVYDFAEGGRDMADLLGDKGANLAEMARMGLPVPPGFTITTEACRDFLATGEPPEDLDRQIGEHLAALESASGKKAGAGGRPAAAVCPLGGVLPAGHDGDHPGHRSERPVGARTG